MRYFLPLFLIISNSWIQPVLAIPLYRVVGSGPIPAAFEQNQPIAMNEHGNIVGFAGHAFFWNTSSGEFVDLGDLGPVGAPIDISNALAINDKNEVAGLSRPLPTKAFIWDANTGMQDLGALAGGEDGNVSAHGINNDSTVVGYNDNLPPGNQAFLWNASTRAMRAIDVLGPLRHTAAVDINNNGDVIINSSPAAFVWNHLDNVLHEIGFLNNGLITQAIAINDSTQVTGTADTPGGNRAFLWSESDGLIDLGVLSGGRASTGMGINGLGHVVGQVTDTQSGTRDGSRAFIWTPQVGMLDLNTLLFRTDPFFESAVDFHLTYAADINNKGQIAALGWFEQNRIVYRRAFLLEPINLVPEPTTLALMSIALAGFGYAKRRTA